MEKLKVPDERTTKNEQITYHTFEDDDHGGFDRCINDPMTATLLVGADKIEIISDRFGDAAEIYAKNKDVGKAVAKVHKGPQFFGWITRIDGIVKIDGPKNFKKEYLTYPKSPD